MSKEAMQQALEALDLLAKWEHPASNITTKTGRIYPQRVAATAADALRQAIEQPEQDPVAWMYDFLDPDNREEVIPDWMTQDLADIEREKGFNVRPLYTRPQPADEEKNT